MKGTLYLTPNLLGDTDPNRVLPPYNTTIINNLHHFIVENIRTTRRFLKKINKEIDIDSLTFYELNQHTPAAAVTTYITPLLNGTDMGIISEAGCPAIADPGAAIVELAQRHGIRVIPLVGPSSILLALMASGFNGQTFAFRGYLPIDASQRTQQIKQLEKRTRTHDETQIFIETPYRNSRILQDLTTTCDPSTRLCVAAAITTPNEYIRTLTIREWKKQPLPDLTKQPTIYLLYK